jgi:hypothetical protein
VLDRFAASRAAAGNAAATGNPRFLDSAVSPPRSLQTTYTQGAPITEQQCTWGYTDNSDYYFGTDDCDQHGSFLYRVALLYEYVAGCLWVCTTFLGQIVRVTSRPEPWFFQPASPNEGIFWRWFRRLGP